MPPVSLAMKNYIKLFITDSIEQKNEREQKKQIAGELRVTVFDFAASGQQTFIYRSDLQDGSVTGFKNQMTALQSSFISSELGLDRVCLNFCLYHVNWVVLVYGEINTTSSCHYSFHTTKWSLLQANTTVVALLS